MPKILNAKTVLDYNAYVGHAAAHTPQPHPFLRLCPLSAR